MPETTPLLSVAGLGISFATEAGPRPAVSDVSFDVAPGEILALVGESGSGKSVTSLAILGLLPRTATVTGSIRLGDTEVVGAPRDVLRGLRGSRVGAIFQEPFTTFNPVMRVGAQIAEAIAAHGPTGPAADRHRHVQALLTRVGLDEPERIARSFPHQLSGGQLQRAMIALAISCQPALLIADEPTTALDVTVQAGILQLLAELRADLGMAVLLITHDMGVVAELADRVVVLQKGVIQETGPAAQVLREPRAAYTRALLDAVPRLDDAGDTSTPPAPAGTAVGVHKVTITYGTGRRTVEAVKDVSFDIPAGQTVGLVGESGSGKTTLGLAVTRLIPVASGVIEVAGRDLVRLSAGQLRAARADIGIVFQDPVASLNPRSRVGAAIALPLKVHRHLTKAERAARVAELLEAVQLPTAYAGRYPHELSGGERQRVAIARALCLRPQLIIADEPTSALDVSVQATILELLARLQAELGFGCLFISHDLAVVRQISHRVVVLRHGGVVEAGTTAHILTEPADEYTRALLRAVPSVDPLNRRIITTRSTP